MKRGFLQELHGVTSQKTPFYTIITFTPSGSVKSDLICIWPNSSHQSKHIYRSMLWNVTHTHTHTSCPYDAILMVIQKSSCTRRGEVKARRAAVLRSSDNRLTFRKWLLLRSRGVSYLISEQICQFTLYAACVQSLTFLIMWHNSHNSGHIHRPQFYLKYNDSESGFCRRLQVGSTERGKHS
jgi:hypothetical protein